MSSDCNFLFIPSSNALPFELLLCFFLFIAVFAFWLRPGGLAWAFSKAHKTAIKGPSGLPLLGLVFSFTNSLTHRTLSNLSKTLKAETLMAFSVGFTRFIISSSPDTAKQILNSSVFSDRPVKESAYQLLFHKAMGFAPYGDYWRNLRRISNSHLFSPRRVSSFAGFRKEIGAKMVDVITSEMERNSVVQIKNVLHFGSLNNVMMTVFGKSYDFENGDGVELASMVKEGYELLGIFNWSDHFPVVGWLDLQSVRKRSRKLVERVNVFVGKIIEEHRAQRGQEEESHDFVHVLLDLEMEIHLSHSEMIAVLWEMIFRGTDTVAILLEWILARMILDPDIQAKAQQELDTIIGINTTLVSDAHLPHLPYLQAIVKETLRMHPPGPLLSWARLAIHDTHVGPHFIPAGTTAMVNMWAICHDHRIWPEPEKFRPERFIEEDVAIMGSDLRLSPFGSGRRVCPGKTMGLASVHLWLAQLLHKFKWSAPRNLGVDLSECLKLSMEMKKPLICQASSRFS